MDERERESFHVDFERALVFVSKLHAEQTRKQTDIPYISHLIAVAGLVLENGGGRDEAIAALLRSNHSILLNLEDLKNRDASAPATATV